MRGADRRRAGLLTAAVLAFGAAAQAGPALPVLGNGTLARTSQRRDGTQPTAPGFGPNTWGGYRPAVTPDGRYVAFTDLRNLGFAACPGDSGSGSHIYLRDRTTGRLELINPSRRGCVGPGGAIDRVAITPDARYVAFVSGADDLVPGYRFPTGPYGEKIVEPQTFVRDRLTKRTVLVSIGIDGKPSNSAALHPSISNDGRYVVFESDATNLIPGDKRNPDYTRLPPQVYLRDLRTGRTERVGPKPQPGWGRSTGTISGNGRYIVFISPEEYLVPFNGHGDEGPLPIYYDYRDQVYRYDRVTRRIEMVSQNTKGEAGNNYSELSWTTSAAISDDGRWVTFASWASNLAPVSVNPTQLHGFTNAFHDVYLRDMAAPGAIVRVSGPLQSAPSLNDVASCISRDGRWVAYHTYASDLGDVDVTPPTVVTGYNQGLDVYLYDRTTGLNRLVSRSTEGIQGDQGSQNACPSSGPTPVVVFDSYATNLVPGDTNEQGDVFDKQMSSWP